LAEAMPDNAAVKDLLAKDA